GRRPAGAPGGRASRPRGLPRSNGRPGEAWNEERVEHALPRVEGQEGGGDRIDGGPFEVSLRPAGLVDEQTHLACHRGPRHQPIVRIDGDGEAEIRQYRGREGGDGAADECL